MFFSKLSLIVFGKFVGRAFDILRQIITARVLSPELFGVFSIGVSIFRIAILITPYGMNKSVVALGGKLHTHSDYLTAMVRQAIFLSMLFGAIGSGLLLMFRPLFVDVFQQADMMIVIPWIALAIFADTISIVAVHITLIFQTVKYVTIVEQIVRPLIQLLVILGLFLLLPTIQSALQAMALSYIASAFLAVYFVVRLLPDIIRFNPITENNSYYRSLISIGLSGIMAGGLINFSLFIDRIMIGVLRPIDEAGLFAIVSQLGFIGIMLMESLFQIIEPLLSQSFEKQDFEGMQDVITRATYGLILITIPFIFFTIFGAEEIIHLMFGSQYSSGAFGLQLFVIAILIQIVTIAPIFTSVLIMTDKARWWLNISLIMIVLRIVINLILIPAQGYVGAIYSYGIGAILLGIISIIILKKQYRFRILDSTILEILFSYLGAFLIMFIIRNFIVLDSWLYLLAQGFVILSSSAIILIRVISKHQANLLEIIRSRLQS